MGQQSLFVCSRCNHEICVSGGYDCGFISESVTIHCKTCHKVLDAFLNRLEVFNDDWTKVNALKSSGELFCFFKCPHSRTKKHDIEPWGKASNAKEGNWACPKCGGKMINNGLSILWD